MKEIPLTQGKVALVDDEDFEAMKYGNKRNFLGLHWKSGP
jgi:hypothetical protein